MMSFSLLLRTCAKNRNSPFYRVPESGLQRTGTFSAHLRVKSNVVVRPVFTVAVPVTAVYPGAETVTA